MAIGRADPRLRSQLIRNYQSKNIASTQSFHPQNISVTSFPHNEEFLRFDGKDYGDYKIGNLELNNETIVYGRFNNNWDLDGKMPDGKDFVITHRKNGLPYKEVRSKRWLANMPLGKVTAKYLKKRKRRTELFFEQGASGIQLSNEAYIYLPGKGTEKNKTATLKITGAPLKAVEIHDDDFRVGDFDYLPVSDNYKLEFTIPGGMNLTMDSFFNEKGLPHSPNPWDLTVIEGYEVDEMLAGKPTSITVYKGPAKNGFADGKGFTAFDYDVSFHGSFKDGYANHGVVKYQGQFGEEETKVSDRELEDASFGSRVEELWREDSLYGVSHPLDFDILGLRNLAIKDPLE